MRAGMCGEVRNVWSFRDRGFVNRRNGESRKIDYGLHGCVSPDYLSVRITYQVTSHYVMTLLVFFQVVGMASLK